MPVLMVVNAFRGGGGGVGSDIGVDGVTEDWTGLAPAPAMFMGSGEDFTVGRVFCARLCVAGRKRSCLWSALVDGVGWPGLKDPLNSFQRAFTGEFPAEVEPVAVQRKPGVRPVRVRCRVYPPKIRV